MAESDYTVTITRKAAREAGIKRYFTGAPCKHGHIAERLEINGSCCECVRLKRLKNYHENIEEERRKQKIRRDSDPNNAVKKWARRVRRDPDYANRSLSWRIAHEARRQARAKGESQFFTGRPCRNGHMSNRFTNDGGCVECNRMACLARHHNSPRVPGSLPRFRRPLSEIREAAAQRKAAHAESVRWWHELKASRQAAFVSGAKTYTGRPCPKGHDGTRYTSGGVCVECAAIRAASPEKKAYDAAYLKKNFARISLRHKQYHERTAERRRLVGRDWVARNKDRVRTIKTAYKARRRQQEQGGDSTPTIHAWEREAPKVCHWCGVKCPKLYHVDHYIPLSKGGKHAVQNLVIACRKCNLRKSARDPYDFAASLGRLF